MPEGCPDFQRNGGCPFKSTRAISLARPVFKFVDRILNMGGTGSLSFSKDAAFRRIRSIKVLKLPGEMRTPTVKYILEY